MKQCARLFVFEGPDGVGKSTLAQATTDHLHQLGKECVYLSLPGRQPGTLGHHVYKLHHVPSEFDVESIDNASLQVLHVAAHIDAVKYLIGPALMEGRHVVLDRYWWSTIVYGAAAEVDKEMLKAIEALQRECWHAVKPDMLFLVQRSAPVNREDSPERFSKLSKIYQQIACQENGNFAIQSVDSNLVVEDAKNAVLRIVDTLLEC